MADLIDTADKIAEHAFKGIYQRPLSAEDFYYLMSQFPFVVVCNSDYAYIDPDDVPLQLRTKNGWIMLVYKDAVCLGSNYLESELYQYEHGVKGLGIWQSYNFKCPHCGYQNEKELRELGANDKEIYRCPKCGFRPEQGLKGIGTLSNQAIEAVIEMVEYIRLKKEWPAIEIIVGHYPVQRNTWIVCELLNYPVQGFDPKPEDMVVKNWFDKIRDRILYPPEKPIVSR